MRNFKKLEAAPFGKPYPADKFFKAEGVFSVIKSDINELNGQPFSADSGVKRRSENGGEYHIHSRMYGGFHKAFGKRPKILAENGNIVIICNAIAMEPLGVDKLLIGEHGAEHFKLKRV